MSKGRIEAFSDGVIAIIITIMVLELRAPHDASAASLRPLWPTFLSYALSYVFLGIYWNNHHHLFQIVRHVNGSVLWANLHLLFWLSLVPFVTGWMGANAFAALPVALYGMVLLFAGLAFLILARVLVRHHGHDSKLAHALGRDLKSQASVLLYSLAIPIALWWHAGVACALYVVVALVWLVPDPRIERIAGALE